MRRLSRSIVAVIAAASVALGQLAVSSAAEAQQPILKGARPDARPIEQPNKYELVVNLKTAKALALTLSPSLLLRATVIE